MASNTHNNCAYAGSGLRPGTVLCARFPFLWVENFVLCSDPKARDRDITIPVLRNKKKAITTCDRLISAAFGVDLVDRDENNFTSTSASLGVGGS